MKKYRPFISLFAILILPLLVYIFLKAFSVQRYRPVEIISERIPNPGQGPDSVFKVLGDFEFLTQTGEKLTRDSLKGKIWIVNLFFGDCQDACDRIHSQISKLQGDYQTYNNIRFVSISTHPSHDSLPVIQKYAARMEANPHQWYMVTGDSSAILNFITKDLKYEPSAPEDLASGVLRETTLRLVDWDGYLRGEFYDGMADDQVVRMAQHIKLMHTEFSELSEKH